MKTNLPDNSSQSNKVGRLFLEVDRYEIGNDGHSYAVGKDLLNNIPGELKIRLTTVDERSVDRPKDNRTKIEQQYNGRVASRDSINDKATSKATVLAFDDLVSTGDGKQNFRAHWSRTLSTVEKPASVIIAPVTHIELQQKTEQAKAKAFVEIIKSNTNLAKIKSRQTLDKAFIKAFSPVDDKNNPQRPFAVMNLRFNNEPVFALLPRLYPSMTTKTVLGSDGKEVKISVPASGAETMKSILSGDRKGKNAREIFALDIFRATYAALTKAESVKIFSEGKNKEYVEAVFNNVKSGKIEVNLAAGLSYNFGPASAQTYLADADKKYLSVFNIEKVVGDKTEGQFNRIVNGYAPVILAMQKFEDGSSFVVNAISADPYPKTKPLNECDLGQASAQHLSDFKIPTIVDLTASEQLELDQQTDVKNPDSDVGATII